MFVFIVDPRGGVSRPDIQAMADTLRGGDTPVRSWCDEHGRAAVAAGATGILPEDVFDRQPIVSDDLIFAAQARIDNRDDILERLGLPRAQWHEIADSEVLYRAYRRWGEDCVQELTGDYAFAAFHRNSGRTVAGVDHIGSVRMFYASVDGKLLLATQLNALLAHSDAPRELNANGLGLLIAPRIEPGTTPFKHVRGLIGGHLLIHEGGTVQLRKWWQPDPTIRTRYRDPRDYVSHTKQMFDRAVAACLRSTSGVSTTMSGGLDSTLVSTTAALQLKARGQTITAYTSVPEPGLACAEFPNWESDDWPYAAAVAALHDNMEHVAVTPGGRCSLDIIGDVHRTARTPVRNVANYIWCNEIAFRSAQRGARVVLGGSKGNATVSYEGDGALGDFFWQGRWVTALQFARQGADGHWPAAARAIAREVAAQKVRDLGARLRGAPNDAPRAGEICLTPDFKQKCAQALNFRNSGVMSRAGMLRFMMNPGKFWGGDDLAQWGVENRDPTGDRALIECLMSFPREAFLIDGRRRGLARAMGEGQVPDVVRLRTTRGAQMPELASIIAAHAPAYRKALECAAQLPLYRSIVDVEQVRALLNRICEGKAAAFEAYTLDRAITVGLFIAGETA